MLSLRSTWSVSAASLSHAHALCSSNTVTKNGLTAVYRDVCLADCLNKSKGVFRNLRVYYSNDTAAEYKRLTVRFDALPTKMLFAAIAMMLMVAEC